MNRVGVNFVVIYAQYKKVIWTSFAELFFGFLTRVTGKKAEVRANFSRGVYLFDISGGLYILQILEAKDQRMDFCLCRSLGQHH